MTFNGFKTEIIKKHSLTNARVTRFQTAHGDVMTPHFMPVATRAFINHTTTDDLQQLGAQIILGGNTFHMLCAPGMEIIRHAGGMHPFMNWRGPMLTDSGGYQVYSLSQNKKICTIDENGAHFKHPISGKVIHLTPRSSIEAQKIIGADIIMAFDECTPETGGRERALAALQRTHRWLMESKEVHDAQAESAYGYKQALFGIIQGGSFRDLREESTQFILKADLDGVAIGGEIIGYDMVKTIEIMNWVRPLLPENKTRYTMGVGLGPQDLLDVVAAGADIFDCVAPSRNARHGALYHGYVKPKGDWLAFESDESRQRLIIKKSIYAFDEQPILPGCECYTCKNYTRSYLHYLFKANTSLYHHFAVIHNEHVMVDVCRQMREFILAE